MEEAEALCDRLGIFVNGELQCIGNAKEVNLSHVKTNFQLHRTTLIPPSAKAL